MEHDDKDTKKSKDSPEAAESSDSDAESLKIVETESTPKRTRKPKQLQFDGRTLDKTIEETMEKCQNFTPEAAKKILLKLVKNEHILALSLLKAEEQEKQERAGKFSDSDDDDKKSENDAPSTPKLTRLKAKQLNQKLPLQVSLNSSEPCEDVVALIQAEMKSDDEDDEYQPCEDDIGSDEDVTNTTFSDIESQPSTPGSALLYNEQDWESPTKVGEFKVPKQRTLSAVSLSSFLFCYSCTILHFRKNKKTSQEELDRNFVSPQLQLKQSNRLSSRQTSLPTCTTSIRTTRSTTSGRSF